MTELTINELFYSLQGESSQAGLPYCFIRLTGCNLRCAYCDTHYAHHQGRRMSLDNILAAVEDRGADRVAITGGEPLLQDETSDLILRLLALDKTVLIETNGSLNIDRADPRCRRIMDIKCPGSGQDSANDPENLNRLTGTDEVKFVLTDRTDYEFARAHCRQLPLPPEQILFSPVTDQLAPDRLADWILADHLPVRLQLQLHQTLWEKERGR